MDPAELERRSRGISRDMSAAAIEVRLRMLGELYEVWQLLRTARRSGTAVAPADRGDTDPQARPVPGMP